MMSDVISFSISREPDKRAGLSLLERGIRLEPVLREIIDHGQETAGPDASEQLLPSSVVKSYESDVKIPEQVLAENKQQRFISKFEGIYKKLEVAVYEENPCKVDEITLGLLEGHPVKPLVQLPKIAQKIFQFFDAVGCEVSGTELRRFIRSFDKHELLQFLAELAQFIDTLKAQAISAMTQGTLGSLPYNILDMLKYLMAFQIIAIRELVGNLGDNHPVSMDLICQILKAPVFLPEFLFFDPCDWDEAKPCKSKREGALTRKVAEKREYKRKVAEKLARAAQSKEECKTQATTTKSRTNSHLHPDCNPEGSNKEDCDCICDCEPVCLPPDPCCADINFYISDTLVLRDKTHCYVAGDLAYIENVAPYETRVRTHEFIKTIEDYSEEETTETRSEERDHQVTERFSLQNEIQKDMSASLDVQARYGGKKAYVQADAHLSKDVSQNEAREKFQESVNRAVSKLQTETRKLSSRRVTTTETEKNKHKFENDTAAPAVAKYFYVNKEMDGQVFSYGIAGQVELLIPSPAKLYEHLQDLKEQRAFKMEKPKYPCLKPSDINTEDYEYYLIKYGLTELEPPKKKLDDKTMSIELSYETSGGNFWTTQQPITIDEGFTATSITLSNVVMHAQVDNANLHRLKIRLSGGIVYKQGDTIGWPSGDNNDEQTTDNTSAIGNTQLEIDTLGLKNFICTVSLYLEANPIDHSSWQMATYKAIMIQYQSDLQAYEEALAAHNRQKEEDKFGTHPFTLKEIILAELKRAAIYMMCEDFERNDVMNMKSEPCGYPEINRSKASEKMWDQYFWDRAFDWEHMSFIFYDYFWNPMCLWPDKFNPDHSDFMFKAFLRAGYVRLVVPCAKGMDGDVYWYTQTRQKWGLGGTLPLNPADPRWMSVVQELKHSKDCFQNDREGYLIGILDITQNLSIKTNKLVLQESTRYWDFFSNVPDTLGSIVADLNREIFIEGVAYKIQAIDRLTHANPDYGHLYDNTLNANEQWIITLERVYESTATDDGNGTSNYHLGLEHHLFAIGAQFVGASFRWQEPTQLVWIGDHENICLPCYPVECE